MGIGDDCALLRPPAGMDLAVTVDTLVEGVHFPATTTPADLGHKALAVNLSDLAAMGAEPAWATLALTLPAADERWLTGFAAGFLGLAQDFGLQLVGGDTTRGPLAVTVQVHGFIPPGMALTRGGASEGDLIFVTGPLGTAGLALRELQEGAGLDADARSLALKCLHRPEPRVAAGVALRGLASAAIDVSDGLLADLGHILAASGVGARLELERLPVAGELYDTLARAGAWHLPLTAGDDYELCFTVPRHLERVVERVLKRTHCPQGCRIGEIEAESGLRLVGPEGPVDAPDRAGWEHFRG